jgi:hypothetical protein
MMADATPEKAAAPIDTRSTDSPLDQSSEHEQTAPLTGWLYKSWKIGPLKIPYYASPKAQLLMVSFVCFLCPGKSQSHTSAHAQRKMRI